MDQGIDKGSFRQAAMRFKVSLLCCSHTCDQCYARSYRWSHWRQHVYDVLEPLIPPHTAFMSIGIPKLKP
jgi:DNA repair photolyase